MVRDDLLAAFPDHGILATWSDGAPHVESVDDRDGSAVQAKPSAPIVAEQQCENRARVHLLERPVVIVPDPRPSQPEKM